MWCYLFWITAFILFIYYCRYQVLSTSLDNVVEINLELNDENVKLNNEKIKLGQVIWNLKKDKTR